MCLVCAWSAPPAFATESSGWRFYTRTDIEGYSPSIPVYGTFHELKGDFERDDEAFTADLIEAGVTRGAWSISGLARYDYHLSFDPDSIELAYRSENGPPLDPGRSYAVRIHVNHVRSAGLKVTYRFQPVPALDAAIAVSALRASELTYGTARGAVGLSDTGTPSGEATYNYTYTEDVLLDRQVDEPTGYGGAVDVALAWQVANRWRLSLTVNDAYHFIDWDDAPYTRATISSDVLSLDEDGVLETSPFLSGVEGERSFTQRLPARYRAGVEYTLSPDWTLIARHLEVEQIHLTDLGARVRLDAHSQLAFAWGAQSGALAISWAQETSRGAYEVALEVDDLDYQAANYIGLRFAMTLGQP